MPGSIRQFRPRFSPVTSLPDKAATGRPPKRREQILNALRRDLSMGKLAPGDKIPSRNELQRQYQTGPVTVQRAVDSLIRDGFVRVEAGRGTYVADYPPHLWKCGLVFAGERGHSSNWSTYGEALELAAKEISMDSRWHFAPYYGAGSPDQSQTTMNQLRQHIGACRLAAVIHPFGTDPSCGFPRPDLVKLPQVIITSSSATEKILQGLPVVHLDRDSFGRQSASWLAERGRKRVAVLVLAKATKDTEGPRVVEHLRYAGLHTQDAWVQGVDLTTRHWAAQVVRLLLNGPADQRPDGLVVTDDNLLEAAVEGIAAAGLRTGDDLDVVSLANFPAVPKPRMPVHLIGFDARTILMKSLELVEAQRQEGLVPEVTRIDCIAQPTLPA